MALSKLGQGSEDAMQLLAGFGADADDGGSAGIGGAHGVLNLAVERIARIATNIIATGSPGGSPGSGGGPPSGPGGPVGQPR